MKVLVVDDQRSARRVLRQMLAALEDVEVVEAASVDETFAAYAADAPDIVLLDVRLSADLRDRGGIDVLKRLRAEGTACPIVMVTSASELADVREAMRLGADDDVLKDELCPEMLLPIVQGLTDRLRLRSEVTRLRERTLATCGLSALLGSSKEMERVRALVRRVADADATVLVRGETGTGKELVARALHELSRRRAGPFIAINCGAVPEPLLESELFGHAKGAFTDAKEKRAGLFIEAAGGTLFLDEVGEMPAAMQVKLLRALETRMLRPVGSNVEVPFDVRIVAATNRDLESAVEERRFREDLLYRLNVIQIELPPLRARGGDILLLAQHFLVRFAERSNKKIRGLSSAVADKLLAYAWPGNVRELQNCIERAVAVTQYEEIVVDDLPEKIRDYRSSHVLVTSDDPQELVSMEEVERRYTLRVLEAVGGNKSMATRILGWDRKTLYRRLEQWAAADRAAGR